MSAFLGGFLGTNPIKTTTTGSTTNNSSSYGSTGSSGVSSSSPDLPDWYLKFLQSLGGNLNTSWSQAQQPVYGAPQTANYMSQLNDLYNSGASNLSQGLASRGALQSGALGAGLTSLQNSRLGNATNFISQLPFQNAQARNSMSSNVLGQMNNFKVPYGTTSTTNQSGFQDMNQNSNGTSDSTSTQQKEGGLLGGLGGLLGGAATSFLSGGLGNLTKGLSFFGNK